MREPLVPAHIDLRDFAFMPLDVARLRDSAIVDEVSGDEFRAAILLWCAAWHQVPAGSLPNDPKQLSKFAGYGRVVDEWAKVSEGALYGWVECSDGRLYHPVIAEKAIEAWEKKSEYTERSAARAEQARAAAGARWGKKDGGGEGGGNGPSNDRGNGIDQGADAGGDAVRMRAQCGSMPGALLKYKGQGQGIDRDNASAAGAPGRRGTDELGGRLRPLVGTLPVVVDPDLSPILKLLAEGLTIEDVETGVSACVERARKRPRAWGDFENWIRRAAKDRLETTGAPPSDRPTPPPDPAMLRRAQVAFAADHFRGRWRDTWPNANRPDHPDCVLGEDVIDEARNIVALERSPDPAVRARAHGYALEPLH